MKYLLMFLFLYTFYYNEYEIACKNASVGKSVVRLTQCNDGNEYYNVTNIRDSK